MNAAVASHVLRYADLPLEGTNPLKFPNPTIEVIYEGTFAPSPAAAS